VLLLAAPLSAAVCGNCVPEHCGLAEMTGTPGAEAESHCQEADETTRKPAGCPSAVPLASTLDCCTMAAAPDTEPSAVPAISASDVFVLEPVGLMVAPTVHSHRIDGKRPRAPQPVPQPLYTLHSAFLI